MKYHSDLMREQKFFHHQINSNRKNNFGADKIIELLDNIFFTYLENKFISIL